MNNVKFYHPYPVVNKILLFFRDIQDDASLLSRLTYKVYIRIIIKNYYDYFNN